MLLCNFAAKLISLKRYFLKLSYNGQNYCGWQTQKGVPTVQQTLEHAVRVFLKDVKGVVGCGRTDTGVHAAEYFAHFDTETPVADEFLYRINAVLPKDIAVQEIVEVEPRLHARFSATNRQYQYFVHYQKNPFKNGLSTFSPIRFDVEQMNEAAKILLDYEDFTTFSKSGTQAKTNICHLRNAVWEPQQEAAFFTIESNRFLRNMVRAIVGTLFLVGEGKMTLAEFRDAIEAKDRSRAGKSVPACGLYLTQVNYPQ